MANKKVTIWKSIRLGDQWRYVRPVVGPNNKIKPSWVKVNGHEEHDPEGAYFLHYLEGRKQIWAKCGPLPTTAVEMGFSHRCEKKTTSLAGVQFTRQ